MSADPKRPWQGRQLDSPASIQSHDSVNVIGAHPLGTLQVQNEQADDGPPGLMDEDEDINQSRSLQHNIDTNSSHLEHEMGGGDVILILDLPEIYTIGYDSVSLTAKHFGGLRDVPPGPHFVWASHPSGMSARCGVWVETTSAANQIHVLQWDRFNEVLGDASKAEARIQANSLPTTYSKLLPYADPMRAGAREMWMQLTSSVSMPLLRRVTGAPLDESVLVHTGDRARGAALLSGELELERTLSGSAAAMGGAELVFSFDQRGKTYSAHNVGAARSEDALDATSYLLGLMGREGLSQDDVVGEMQVAFIMGMHLGNESCLQQWWYMVQKLVFKAFSLVTKRPELVASLLRAVAAQITYDVDWMESSAVQASGDVQSKELRIAMVVYKRRLEDAGGQMDVELAFKRVEGAVASLGWDVDAEYLRKGKVVMEDGEEVEVEMAELAAEDERGEWAPEVVELDEDGREKGLLSWD